MNDLIQSFQEKLGLTAEQAKDAASHALEYFKSKVPPLLQEHLDAAALGDTIKTKGAEMLAEAQAKGGDLLQNVQEKVSSFLHSSKEA